MVTKRGVRNLALVAGLVALLCGCVELPQFRLQSGQWRLRNANSAGSPNLALNYAGVNHIPVAGDWNGDGTETVGTFVESTRRWYLRNTNTPGNANLTFTFGPSGGSTIDGGYPTRVPVVGDWNGDGIDTIGVFDRSTATWYLRNANTTGGSTGPFRYGAVGDIPVTGDWNGDGVDTVGIVRSMSTDDSWPMRWSLRNSNTAGNASITPFTFGAAGLPVVGDWNGDGRDTAGWYAPFSGTWNLRNANSAGSPNTTPFQYLGGLPNTAALVVGDWNGDGKDTVGRAR